MWHVFCNFLMLIELLLQLLRPEYFLRCFSRLLLLARQSSSYHISEHILTYVTGVISCKRVELIYIYMKYKAGTFMRQIRLHTGNMRKSWGSV